MPVCLPDDEIGNRIIPEMELKVSGFGDTGKMNQPTIFGKCMQWPL